MRQNHSLKQFPSFALVHGDYLVFVSILCKTKVPPLLFPEIMLVLRGIITPRVEYVWMQLQTTLGLRKRKINTSRICK
jgi:hypothetical protein